MKNIPLPFPQTMIVFILCALVYWLKFIYSIRSCWFKFGEIFFYFSLSFHKTSLLKETFWFLCKQWDFEAFYNDNLYLHYVFALVFRGLMKLRLLVDCTPKVSLHKPFYRVNLFIFNCLTRKNNNMIWECLNERKCQHIRTQSPRKDNFNFSFNWIHLF